MRDMVGYGNHLPSIRWPENARLALNFVINYEEGAEQNILDGDKHSESYLTDWPGIPALEGKRHLSSESLFEYGSRAGIWRLLNLFESYQVPLTFFICGLALEKNPNLAHYLKESPHEVAGHGYRWKNYAEINLTLEKEDIQRTLYVIQNMTGKKICGWYTGRKSENTRKLLIDTNILYDSDSYSDDLPYWEQASKRPYLIIPYSLETNDARYAVTPGWSGGDDFLNYLKRAFDCLYREGERFPKMMTIGLHARLSGRPARSEIIRLFLEYVKSFDSVWICTRENIAKHWYENLEMS